MGDSHRTGASLALRLPLAAHGVRVRRCWAGPPPVRCDGRAGTVAVRVIAAQALTVEGRRRLRRAEGAGAQLGRRDAGRAAQDVVRVRCLRGDAACVLMA